jgi:excisionase family DNA binding protein
VEIRHNPAQQRPRAPKRSSDLEPELVAVEDAAPVLGIGRSTFYKDIINQGLIEPVYIGRRVLIAVEDVRELAKQLRAAGDLRKLVAQRQE